MTVVPEFYANAAENTLTPVVFLRGSMYDMMQARSTNYSICSIIHMGQMSWPYCLSRPIWKKSVMKFMEGAPSGTLLEENTPTFL